jgi:hypothetical protein
VPTAAKASSTTSATSQGAALAAFSILVSAMLGDVAFTKGELL